MLARAIDSVLGQRGVDLEVIVADDGSSDGTSEAVEAREDPRVRVIRRDIPEGPASARNTGIAHAAAPWIAFIDDDDVWAPDRLSSQFDALQRVNGAWAIAGAVTVDERLRALAPHRPPSSGDMLSALLRCNVIPGGASGVVARADLLRAAGAFDVGLRVLADWELWIRLATLAPAVAVDRPLVGYAVHAHNMTTRIDGIALEIAAVHRKHAALFESRGAVENTGYWRAWLAELDRRGGRRIRPASELTRLAVETRHPLLALRAAAVVAHPAWVAARDRRRAQARALGWVEEADEWLSDLREGAAPGGWA